MFCPPVCPVSGILDMFLWGWKNHPFGFGLHLSKERVIPEKANDANGYV
jgi:hypothetical protein